VVLTVDGETQSHPLRVEPDPDRPEAPRGSEEEEDQ
jgi:hypothetical protein